MKYLKKFSTETQYNDFLESDDYVEPHVVMFQDSSNKSIMKYKEKEILTIEYGKKYPDILENLIGKYGYYYGENNNPSPFDGEIYVKNFPRAGEGYVKYIATNGPDMSTTVRLYLEDYQQTYYCVILKGYRLNNDEDYGLADEYLWD